MTVGTRIMLGFGAALAALVVSALVSYRSTTQLLDASQSVTHTYEVLTELETLLSLMKDAETGQRGYLLTGVKSYLEPYTAARNKVKDEFDELRNLTTN